MTIRTPWKRYAATRGDAECLAMVSYFRLKGFGAMPRFAWNALRVGRQLGRSDGLLCSSSGARLRSFEFWSVTVWEDEQALMRFVRASPHSEIMEEMRPYVRRSEFVRWGSVGRKLRRIGGRRKSCFAGNWPSTAPGSRVAPTGPASRLCSARQPSQACGRPCAAFSCPRSSKKFFEHRAVGMEAGDRPTPYPWHEWSPGLRPDLGGGQWPSTSWASAGRERCAPRPAHARASPVSFR